MKLLFSLLLWTCFFSVTAQKSFNDTLKLQMVKEWERAKSYTQEYLNAVPADKYGFRPTDSVRTFAEQMLHLASANAGLIFVSTGSNYPFAAQNLEKSPTAQSKDSVMYYINTSYDFAIHAIQNLDFNKLGEVITRTMPGGKRTEIRLAWLLKAFEHQTHHRGQCTIYLRLMGIKPPSEKLF